MRKPHYELTRDERINYCYRCPDPYLSLGDQYVWIQEKILEVSREFEAARDSGDLKIIRSLQKEYHTGKGGMISAKDGQAAYPIAVLSLFEQHGARVYKISEVFGRYLNSAPLNIQTKYIPLSEHPICIELPENMRHPCEGFKNNFICSAYAMVVCPSVEIYNDSVTKERITNIDRVIQYVCPIYDSEGNLDPNGGMDAGTMALRKNLTFDENIEKFMENSTCEPDPEFMRFLVKSLIYINSGDPDLREFRPKRQPHNPKKYNRWKRDNLCGIPMSLVGWEWKKDPIIREGGKINVTWHLKWQPHGPGLTMVKLIEVDSYPRRKWGSVKYGITKSKEESDE